MIKCGIYPFAATLLKMQSPLSCTPTWKKNTYARIVYATAAHPTESDGERSPTGFKPDLLSPNP